MFVRRSVLVVVSSAVLAFSVGCSGADSTGDSSTDSSKSRSGQGKSNGDDSSSNGDGTARNGSNAPKGDGNSSTDTSRAPSNPPKTSKKKNGAQCTESADCESDFCVFQGNGLGMCTTTCDSNIDCDLGHSCVKLGNAPQKACVPD